MNVVALLPAYPPAARFGAPLATHRFLAHLVGRGHSVAVGRLMGRGAGYEVDGVSVDRAQGLGAALRLAGEADVVISHGGSRIDMSTVPCPKVRIAHGFDADDLDVDLVVCNSEGLRDHLVDIGRLTGPSIICRPPTVAAEHRVDQTGDRITLVNCSKDKGVITAWKVSDALPDHRFLGVKGGYGSQDHTPRNPNWTIWPTQQDMRTVWAETRILLMPSAFETWGMAGVEAMCSGIPVIAHPTPGLRESLGDAGIFCDRDDIASWVAEVRRLDDPHEYEVASKAARARADELDPTPDLDRFADAVEALCS